MSGAEKEDKAGLVSLRAGSTDSGVVEDYYDSWAASYDETLKDWRYATPSDAADLLVPLLPTGAAVLDVGCGTGGMGAELVRRGQFDIDGLDISTASLALAAERGCYRALTQCDLQKLPLPAADSSYEAAVSVGVLTYIEDGAALMRDLCRIVRPDGMIAFTMRSDLWAVRRYPKLLKDLAAAGLWSVHHISAPLPYLPGNEDFQEDIKVIHTLCRVLG
ncbi:class I SAM-dependent DNA methyltransferase [Thalassobius sp. MITS945101]|uniref:class I SAM-dependent DNA methyltransferase n=1 Tax=Thalassobius sp. MITS945101 TaxID=3096994 RepID=UPI00399B22A6